MAKKINLAAARGQRISAALAAEVLQKVSPEATFYQGADIDQTIGPVIPTGIFPLDFALAGGVPTGRVSMFFGLENSTKTTTCLKTIANAQQMCAGCFRFVEEDGCECKEFRPFVPAILDVEGTMDLAWARKLGVDVDNILYSKPETAEATLELVDKLLVSTEVDLILVDSLAALETKAELEGDYTKAAQPGSQAKLLSHFARKMASRLSTLERETGYRPTILLTNQIRYKIGVMFGDPEVKCGGKAFDFFTATEVRLRGSMKSAEKTNELTHNEVHFRVDKAKRALLREGDFRFLLATTSKKKMGEVYDEAFIISRSEFYGLLVHQGKQWVLSLPGHEPKSWPKREAVEEELIKGGELRKAWCKALLARALHSKEEGE